MSWEFWAGVAVGSILTTVVWALIASRNSSSGELQKVFQAEDKVKQETEQQLDEVEKAWLDEHG